MDKSKRLASLDALRGFDMMFIMGVSGLILYFLYKKDVFLKV